MFSAGASTGDGNRAKQKMRKKRNIYTFLPPESVANTIYVNLYSIVEISILV